MRSFAAMQADARKPQRCAGCGDQAALRRQRRHGIHQEPSSFTVGSPRSAATFLRNTRLGGRALCLLQHESQRLRSPLKIAQDALPVSVFIVCCARIGVGHAVSERIIEQNGDFAHGCSDSLGFADTGR